MYDPKPSDQIRHGIQALKALSDLLCNVNGEHLDLVQSDNLCGLVQIITEVIEGGVSELEEERRVARIAADAP